MAQFFVNLNNFDVQNIVFHTVYLRKQICLDNDDHLPRTTNCLVYSFGVAFDTSYEDDISFYAPSCEIHLFDPAVYMNQYTKVCLPELYKKTHQF